MRCASCNRDNPADASFCEQCGAKLELSCPACGAPVNRGARFCRKCGSQIDERSTSTAPIRTEPQLREGPTGERRHLTVLFCDLVGSTEQRNSTPRNGARPCPAIIAPPLKR